MTSQQYILAVIGIAALVIIALIVAATKVWISRGEEETERRKNHDNSIVEATRIAVRLLQVSVSPQQQAIPVQTTENGIRPLDEVNA